MLLLLTAASAGGSKMLFESAFSSAHVSQKNATCFPEITKGNVADPNLSDAARTSLLKGTLLVNDKSKGSGWLIQLAERKSIRYDLPFTGGNHESAVSPDGRHFVIPHYETPTYNSTEGGGAPGANASILDVHTGRTAVLPMKPSPFVYDEEGYPLKDIVEPKPHDAQFLPDGDVLLTGQVANSIWRVNAETGDVTVYSLAKTGCSTPHLVRTIPRLDGGSPTFAVSGCRGSNADTPDDYVGKLAMINLETGDVAAFETPGAKWDEGITVTNEGEVWVGSLYSHFVTVFGWKGAATDADRSLDNVETLDKIEIRYPLRLAYDEVADRVAVATIDQASVAAGNTSDSKLNVYDAKTHDLVKSMQLKTERGVINSEGLRNGPGFFYTGGYDTQALVVVDSSSLEVVVEIMLPHCTMQEGFCGAPITPLPNSEPTADGTAQDTAAKKGYTGYNNWSGGLCQATERSPYDRRFATLDGFNYSPVFPRWALL